MNTSVCFVFLLAIGLSLQNSEFEIDFDKMVNSIKLTDGGTLWNCPAKCEDAKDQCQCVDFSSCMNHSVCKCLEMFNFAPMHKNSVCKRLERLPRFTAFKTIDWNKPQTPRTLLKYTQNTHQLSVAQSSG